MNEKKQANALQIRQAIVRSSLELFSRLGFEKVTMDDIARRSDYSKRTVYQYFSSKESVYYAAVLCSFQSLYDTVFASAGFAASGDKIAANHTDNRTINGTKEQNPQENRVRLRDAFFDLCVALFRLYTDNPLAFDAMVSFSQLPDAHSPYAAELTAIYECGEQINALLCGFLRTLSDAGLVKENLPEIPTVFMIWSSLTGIFALARSKQDYLKLATGMQADTYVEYTFALLFRAIAKN